MLSISLELLLVPQHFERIHFRGEVCGQDARHKRNANQQQLQPLQQNPIHGGDATILRFFKQ